MENRRIRLIEQLCRLPESQLSDVEALLKQLDGKTIESQPLRPVYEPSSPENKDWPHAPVHRLSEHGTFIVTASTLNRHHYFRGVESLTMLEGKLLELAMQHAVVLEAWAVFSNHYHFVAHTTGVENRLTEMIKGLHFTTAEDLNQRDQQPGREVWFNFWETQLTYEKSYLARLNYVHQNAVKHRLVQQANEYRWCSAAWFERRATRAQVKTIYGFKTDRVKIDDDYEPVV